MGIEQEQGMLPSCAYAHISSVLEFSRDEITDIWPLKQGLTNESWHFTTPEGEYVYRQPGVGTEDLVDREAEVEALKLARSIGLDGTFIYEDVKQGWKLSRFLVDCRELDARDAEQVACAMRMARTLHESGARLARTFDFYEEGKRYDALLRELGPIEVPGYDELAAKADRVAAFAHADGAPVCITHNDFFNLNILIDRSDRMHLIDWEYGAMGDYGCDLGNFFAQGSGYAVAESVAVLDLYFGRAATAVEVRHCLACTAVVGFYWYVWAMFKESQGNPMGEWLYKWYRAAIDYADAVEPMYETDACLCKAVALSEVWNGKGTE